MNNIVNLIVYYNFLNRLIKNIDQKETNEPKLHMFILYT